MNEKFAYSIVIVIFLTTALLLVFHDPIIKIVWPSEENVVQTTNTELSQNDYFIQWYGIVEPTLVAKTKQTKVYKFRDDGATCYIAEPFDTERLVSISCVLP